MLCKLTMNYCMYMCARSVLCCDFVKSEEHVGYTKQDMDTATWTLELLCGELVWIKSEASEGLYLEGFY